MAVYTNVCSCALCRKDKRISGYMYDAHTGIEIGVASDEMKAEFKSGIRHMRIIAGIKQDFMIEP